ncbi:MAG: hypothetical protein VW441_06700, partial [Flavobacteriaceae bacterium]
RIEKKDKEAKKELLELISKRSKQLDSLLDTFLGKVDKRQGIVRNPESSVVRRLYSASRYIRSRPSGITATEEELLSHAQTDLKAALEQTNAFYKKHWQELKTQIEAVQLSDFKGIHYFELD